MAVNAIYLGIGGTVIALDRATGDELWRTWLKGADQLVNVVVNGRQIYATTNGKLFCLDASNGELIWYNRPSMGWWGIFWMQVLWRMTTRDFDFNVNVVLDGEQIYVTTKGEILCQDAISGELLWDNHLSGLGQGRISIAIPSGGQGLSVQEKHNLDQRDVTSASTA